MSLLDTWPLRATHDPDGALRALIARQLARQTYRIPGGEALAGVVVEGHVPTPDGVVCVHEEWADAEDAIQLPALVILDGMGSISAPPLNAAIDESTVWPGGTLESVALRGEGEWDVTYTILAQATDRAARRALLLGAWSALSGALDFGPEAAERFGLLLPAGDLYWNRTARIIPLGFGRTDTEDSAGAHHRAATLSVRATIPIVSPVVLPALTDITYTDPPPTEAMRGLEVGG